MIQPRIPGINRLQGCTWIRGITGGPHAINNEGVKTSIDCNTDGIIVRDSIIAKVSAKIVSRSCTIGSVDPVVKVVWLRGGAHRSIVPCSVRNGVRICPAISTNIRLDVTTSITPGACIGIQAIMDGLLRVVPLGSFTIVIEPIVNLNSSYIGNPTPVALMLVPIIGGCQHPGMI